MIRIVKTEDDTSIYIDYMLEPAIIVYNEGQLAVSRELISSMPKEIIAYSQAVGIAAIIVRSLNRRESKTFTHKLFKVKYFSVIEGEKELNTYSPKNILSWLKTGAVVTTNKKERIKREFTGFELIGDVIIIHFKPVIW